MTPQVPQKSPSKKCGTEGVIKNCWKSESATKKFGNNNSTTGATKSVNWKKFINTVNVNVMLYNIKTKKRNRLGDQILLDLMLLGWYEKNFDYDYSSLANQIARTWINC